MTTETEQTVADDIAALEDQDGPDASELIQQTRLRNSSLAGATNGFVIQGPEGKKFVLQAVMHLMTCEAHGGVHHFAVTDDGQGLWISDSAVECINSTAVQPAKTRPAPKPIEDVSLPSTSPRERCEDCGGVEVAPYRFDHADDCPSK